MYIEFAHPWALVFLPVLIGIVVFTYFWDKKRNGRSFEKSKYKVISEIVLRSIILCLMVFALSQVNIMKQDDTVTTVFLVDMSDSMKNNWEDEVTFVKDAINGMSSKDKAGIIIFGKDAKIEQFVSDKKAFVDVQSSVKGTATDLEQAVSTALALYQDGTAKRMVLLSDGRENEGTLADMASTIVASGIEFKSVNYDSKIEKEVYVDEVTLPKTINKGDKFRVNVSVYATKATDATVSLYSGRTLKGQKEVSLQNGINQLVFTDEGVEDGLKSYRVTVESKDDTISVNNSYNAFTTVKAKEKILLVEGESGEGEEFEKLLKSVNIEYDIVTPFAVPKSVTDMLLYKSVVLLDVYADDLREGFMDSLKTYVEDYAGGLVTIGGSNSYALGNYKDTPLEEILPVSMELEGEKKIPKIAMTMVIDRSSSMSASTNGIKGYNCLDLAKQAAINSLDSLRSTDEVGILCFDDKYKWAVPMQTLSDKEQVMDKTESIAIGGGTSIYPALAEAVSKMEESDATIKHIVLLTDGEDGYRGYEQLLNEINSENITLSTVAVGEASDSNLLSSLANQGGGRYYYTDAGTSLPRIFAQEVYLSTKNYLKNEEFTPVLTNSHEITDEVFSNGSPSLLGYIATTPKNTSTVLLESDEKEPVLAVWQYGLGRTVAWTSDGSNEWTGNFAAWDEYPKLWRNIIDWTIQETDIGEDYLTVQQKDSSVSIDYEAKEYDKNTKVSAIITGEDGNKKEVELKPSSPGKFTADVPVDDTGVYTISLRNLNNDKVIKTINTATAMQYSKEYKYADMSTSLTEFMSQVNGVTIEKSDEVFNTKIQGEKNRHDISNALLIIALILFVADILCRRLSVDWLGYICRKVDTVRIHNVDKKPAVIKTADVKSAKEQSKKEKTLPKFKIKQNKEKEKENTTRYIDTAALLKKKEERDL